MDARKFLDEFEHITNAPNGVQRLREMILQLAVQGRLSQQTPEEEQAAPLLDEVKKDEVRLVTIGLTRKQKPLPKMSAKEAPFNLPESWRWIRIGEAMHLQNGKAFKSAEWSNSGVPIIRIQNLNNPKAAFNHCNIDVEDRYHVTKGDLLISWSGTPGTSFGAFIWDRLDAYLNQHIFKATVYGPLHIPYIKLAINSRLMEMIAQAQGGVGLRHITKTKLVRIPLPLPPLNEQKRIVAKVDELMTLCDKLEEQQKERKKLHGQAQVAVLNDLRKCDEAVALSRAWARSFDNWNLFSEATSVDDLRSTILELALKGILTLQSSDEKSGDSVLQEIANTRSQLSFKKALQPITVKETLFKVPDNWSWTKLDQILTFGPTNGYSPKPVKHRTTTRSLTLSATTSGSFDSSYFKYIDEKVPEDSHLWLEPGDILIQRGNSKEYVGISAPYRGDSHSFIYPDLMMKIRISGSIDTEFVHLALLNKPTRNYFLRKATGTSGSMPKINQATVRATPIPIPPLEEQKRIVAKVNSLMSICDELENQITAKSDIATKLATASVEAITGSIIEEQKKMKTPKTELISTLRSGKTPTNKDTAPLAALLIRNNGEMSAKGLWRASGLDIDKFYQQLKTEIANNWIDEPDTAHVKEIEEAV